MKIFVKTFGCTFNQRDSENIKGVLDSSHYDVVSSVEESDVIVVNSCGVKGVTESKVISYIKSLGKPVYVGGCLPKMVDLFTIENVKGVFDTNTITKLPEQIEEGIEESFSEEKENRLNLHVVKEDENKLIVPISQGCLGQCHYCSVKYVRGGLKSYKIEEIVSEVKKFNGEFVYLTSQDSGCYGFDIDTSLVELLKDILMLDKKFKLRIGMMNPEHLEKILPGLIEIYKDERVMKFIHIPVQSGSNKVLKAMNRKYSIEEFKDAVKVIRKELPEVHIATDVIVGYPTESKNDFKATVEMLKEFKFEVVNLSKYTPRPKTYSKKFLKPLKSEVVKERSVVVSKLI